MKSNFEFYGYNTPTSGKYYIDGNEYNVGEDFRTVKRFKEYKNTGFTILLLQHENSYSGEEFKGSACETCMINAFKAGIDKIIVSDTRIKALCVEENLLGSECKFKDEESLIEYLNFCTKPYREMPGFYGLQLYDEPEFKYLKSYSIVVRALKKILPTAFLQCNLLNIVEKERLTNGNEPIFDAYKKYLETFLNESGQKVLMYDDYPFRRDYIICGYSIRNYQIAAQVCKEKGAEFHTVLQTFSWVTNGRLVMRRVTEKDVRWQANMCLGFGVREFSFFTYFTKQSVKLKDGFSTDGIDGAAMINRDGTRTKLYYAVKKIIAEMKSFERIALNYNYKNNYLIFERGKNFKDFEQTEYAVVNGNCPISVEVSSGVALVTESKSDLNAALYMIENIGNVKDELNGALKQTVKVTLPAGAKSNWYHRGVKFIPKNTNNEFFVSLGVGDAVFIEVI